MAGKKQKGKKTKKTSQKTTVIKQIETNDTIIDNITVKVDTNIDDPLTEIKDSLLARGINYSSTEQMTAHEQTYPPTKTIPSLYPKKDFPSGEIIEYQGEANATRKTSGEKQAQEKIYEQKLSDLREAAEIHRQVRQYIQRIVKPGMKLIDICELLEEKNRQLIGLIAEEPLKRGIGFPTGVSLNNVAAHYTPNSNDQTVLLQSDIMKVDFGTQVNGNIIDCAFTATFDEKYDAFLGVVKEATNTGIREMGVDVRLCDIGAAINEVMKTDVLVGDELHKMQPVRNLNGHNIGPYMIHNGKSVPLYDNGDQNLMEEGELYAIETFGTTGTGVVKDSSSLDCSHYMKNSEAGYVNIDSKMTRELLNFINKNFGTLAFCRRWLDRGGQNMHSFSLKKLVAAGVVEPYPALEDKKGSYTAQYEHTILLRPTCKEVVSRGFDF